MADVSAERPNADVVERIIAVQRSSVDVFRRSGRTLAVRRAQRGLAHAELLRDAPLLAAQMFACVAAVRETADRETALVRTLEGGIALLHADLGNVQTRRLDGSLEIVCHSGFDDDFLDHFARVEDTSSACGRAARGCAQVVVPDVRSDPSFAPHRAIAAASGFRAVQSTPLFDADGRLLGMLSTHFAAASRPSRHELVAAAWYGELVGPLLPGQLRSSS
jgi:GAF domain-containing protein